MSDSHVGHEYLVSMLDTNILFYVRQVFMIRMLDTNIWFVCWTRISGSNVGQ